MELQKSSKLVPFTLAGTALIGGLGVSFLVSSPVEANMKFARDTGLSCASCHSTPSNPTKQALTNVGVRFKTCIYNPNPGTIRSEEHTSELQSRSELVCRLLLEKKEQSN